MENCCAILFKYTTNIQNADISLENLKVLKHHKERFFEVLEIIQPGEEINEIKIQFEQRLKDFTEYKRIKTILQYIGDFLQNVPERIGNNHYFIQIFTNFYKLVIIVVDY